MKHFSSNDWLVSSWLILIFGLFFWGARVLFAF